MRHGSDVGLKDLADAVGAGLLCMANLLVILIGGLIVLAIPEPYFQDNLRRSRSSRRPVPLSIGLLLFIGEKLLERSDQYLYELR